MKSSSTVPLFFLFSLLVINYAPLSQAAESTADSTVTNAIKEQIRQEIISAPGSEAVGEEEYRIGHRDIIDVQVYGEGSMAIGNSDPNSSTGSNSSSDLVRGRGKGIEVRIDGRVSLLNLGDVYLVGMTFTQAADYLKKLYSYIYKEPSLTVSLVQSNSLQYTVMGQVNAPGRFHLDFPIAIVEAIAKAGGFAEWANSEVTVIRKPKNTSGTDTKGQSFSFDYDDFLKGKNIEENIMIKPGDIIVAH